jgi:hypothetical protein
MRTIFRNGWVLSFFAVWVLSCGKSTDLDDESRGKKDIDSEESGIMEKIKGEETKTAIKSRTAARPSVASGAASSSGLSAVLNNLDADGQTKYESAEIKSSSQNKTRMIIKNGELTMEIEKYDDCMVKIQKISDSSGGFISDSKMDIPYAGVKRGNIEIRIPSEKFETLMIEIKKLASKVEVEGVKGTDVSEEFFDLEARLINKQKAEARMQEIMKAAKTVREILEVERELTGIREDIERFEGRRRFLADQASLSTIRVTMHEPYPVSVSSSGGFWATIGDGFVHGIKGFAVILSGTIAFLIAGIPVFALIFLIVYLTVKTIKRSRRKKIQVITPPQS